MRTGCSLASYQLPGCFNLNIIDLFKESVGQSEGEWKSGTMGLQERGRLRENGREWVEGRGGV